MKSLKDYLDNLLMDASQRSSSKRSFPCSVVQSDRCSISPGSRLHRLRRLASRG